MQTTPRANTQRILQGSATPVARGVLRDQDGEPGVASGTITADIVDLDGVVSGTAGRAATHDTDIDMYTVALTTAEAASLAVWRVDWKEDAVLRTSTWHRIVGGFLFSRGELRDMKGIPANLPDVQVDLAREWITTLIEHQTGAAWSPRHDVDVWVARDTASYRASSGRYGVSGDRHVTEFRPVRTVQSITIDGTAAALGDVTTDLDAGVIYGLHYYRACSVAYDHGYDTPTEPLRRAGLIAAQDLLLRGGSGLSERTRTQTNDLGITQTFSFPGLNHPTGIDFVDAAILDADQRLPGIA